jgi:RimJ/RimL family protein N-acetyltransferase
MENHLSIETDRLYIRILDMQDREALYGYRSLPEIYRYQTWRPKDITEADAFIKDNLRACPNTEDTWLQVAVCLKEGQMPGEGEMIGDIGIHFIDADYQIEIGYTLSPKYQSRGYAAEAVKAVIKHAFAVWRKHRIIASVHPENIKSIRLLENIGFRKEAHFIKSFRMDNEWQDDCIYALLAEEWDS